MQKFEYQKLVKLLETLIEQHRWMSGEKLPSIRAIATQYQLSKNTVIKALHTLEASGKIEARAKVGYYVTHSISQIAPLKTSYSLLEPTEVTVPKLFFDVMNRGAAFDILPGAEQTPPSNHLIKLNRHISKAMRLHPMNKAMYYDKPFGNFELRHEINNRYRQRGLDLTTDQICITSGCQHALFLALLATCKAGDNVAVESPAFYGVLQLLEQLKLNIVEIPSDPKTGVMVSAIESICEQWDISALVVSPAFATPTGASIPEDNKKAIIQIANRHQLAVIEDDIYGELGFEYCPSPLKAFDTQDRVILCSSFSKSLSRDLRLGWISGGLWHQSITQLRMVSQLAASQSAQEGVASFMAEGNYRRHLTDYNSILRRQRDQLSSTISKHWVTPVKYCLPNGGLTMWIELPENVDTLELYKLAITKNITIMPGMLFCASNHFSNYLRLSFNHACAGSRKIAIIELGRLISSIAVI
jgi:DNA-binding transcriptional MocR family regulator